MNKYIEEFRKSCKKLEENNIILDEAKQVGLLYHTTSLDGFLDIVKTNSLASSRPNGISFSRDKNNWFSDGPFTLVLDGDKLSNNNKLYPFSYHAFYPTEYPVKDTNSETSLIPRGYKKPQLRRYSSYEDIYGDTNFVLNDLNKYIVGLLINPNNLDERRIKYSDIPNIYKGNINGTILYCENLFKNAYPNSYIQLSNNKGPNRQVVDDYTQNNYNKYQDDPNTITFDDIIDKIETDYNDLYKNIISNLSPEEINNLVKKYANILQKENKNKTLEPGLLKSLNLR